MNLESWGVMFKKGYYRFHGGVFSIILYLDKDLSHAEPYTFKVIKGINTMNRVTLSINNKQFTRLPAYGTPLYKTLNN